MVPKVQMWILRNEMYVQGAAYNVKDNQDLSEIITDWKPFFLLLVELKYTDLLLAMRSMIVH